MITIDNEFQNLIPPLTDEEFAQLETNILRDGIRDALITWHGILIDGHNRYRIAQKHGLTYRTVEKNFADRNDAERWIILNQFGRRNLSAYDRSILALKLKPIIAEKAKENLKVGAEITNTGLQKSVKAVNTQKELAKVAGVSHDTIAKVEKIQAKASPEIKSAIKSGEMSINQAYQTLKREEKKIEIEQAEKKVADEYKKQEIKPVIHVGDSFDYEPSEPYKLLLTDPPYSTDVANIDGFAKSWLPKALKNVRDDGFAYVFIGAYPEELKAYLNVETPAHIKLEQVLIWTYKNTLGNNPKDRYKLNYQRHGLIIRNH
jgi:ParB-like chromosome segregation protein Spo0J